MTIQRKPRPQRRRQITAFLLSASVLYLVTATAASKISHDLFCQNDDGRGQERGKLVTAILAGLRPGNEAKWDKVWESRLCQRYRRQEHSDCWLWSHDFYTAPVDELRQIAALFGG